MTGRPSRARIIAQLKVAAKKGDRVALERAIDQMKTWAYSPRYWERYLLLLAHPLARLVDLTVIRQGERIARQKGWVKPRREPPKRPRGASAAPARRPARRPKVDAAPAQASLFEDAP